MSPKLHLATMASSSPIRPLPKPSRPPEGMDRAVAHPRRRRWIWAAAAAAGLAILALAVWLAPRAGSISVARSDLEIAEARRAPFEDYLPLRGEIAPLTTVYATAVEGGQVKDVLAQEGAQVAAGAPLARLVNPQLQLDVTAREAEIAARLGDVSAQELALERARTEREQQIDETGYDLLKARRELERRETLHAAGIESDSAMRTYADEADYHQARLAALKRDAAQARTIAANQSAHIRQMADRLNRNLAVVQDSLGALVVRAPAAGRLTNFTLQPGQTLKAGDTVGQVDSERAYKLVADIDEFYLRRVAIGQSATAQVDGRTYALKVSRVLPQVTNGRFQAELVFAGAAPAELRRGQSLDLRLTLGGTQPALVLPNGAWMATSAGGYAFVVSGGRAERRPVVVGRRNPDAVEVLKGLRPGDRVIVSDYANFASYRRLVLHGKGPA